MSTKQTNADRQTAKRLLQAERARQRRNKQIIQHITERAYSAILKESK